MPAQLSTAQAWYVPIFPLVKRLEAETYGSKFDDLGMILFDQAHVAEGGQLDDPAAFVGRPNKLMLNMFMPVG